MQPSGIEFLRPIWELISQPRYLNISSINVYYTKYINNYKQPVPNGEPSVDDAVRLSLTPGKVAVEFKL